MGHLAPFGAGESVFLRIIIMKPPEKLYHFHVANLQAIDAAMERVARALRDAIARNDTQTVDAFVRLYALLLGAWAECRLCKLLFESTGFIQQARADILEVSHQLDRWHKAVDTAFRTCYGVPRAPLSERSLPYSAFARFTAIQEALDDDLQGVIQLRNKLAHGQWAYPLNDRGDDVAQEQMDALRVENLLSLQFKKTLLSYLCDTIHDLVVSRPTFERDFDAHYRLIVETRRNLRTRKYQSYERQLREKHLRGRARAGR